MPGTVEDLVWYVMCFIVSTGIPSLIILAAKIHKLLYDVVVKQALQEQWIKAHEQASINNLEEIWGAIDSLRKQMYELAK